MLRRSVSRSGPVGSQPSCRLRVFRSPPVQDGTIASGNHMILTMGELLGETFAFLGAGGVSGAETKAALLDALMPSVFAGYAQRMVEAPGRPGPAASAIGRKDNALALEAARQLGVELPLARFLAREVIRQAG